ncbi:MAG TPA: DMT family transporter [Tepidisphaeraceae bacterium]|nr:DMT family transporter [Tepidisphaeraceae bacterium]
MTAAPPPTPPEPSARPTVVDYAAPPRVVDHSPPPPARWGPWLFYSLLAIAFWGVRGIVSKAATNHLPPPADLNLQVISTLGVVPIALLLLASPNVRKHPGSVRRGALFGFLTGICGSVGNLCFFSSMERGGEVSTVLPLTSVYPLVTVVLAMAFLRERLNRYQVVGMAVALVSLYLFNKAGQPAAEAAGSTWDQRLRSPWMVLALVTLILFGVAAVTQKLATNNISSELSTVCFALAFIPVALAVIAWRRQEIRWDLSATGWTLAILTGAFISTGTLILFAAYRTGKAAVVTALTAMYPLLTALLAVKIFGESLGGWKVLAIVLALAASVALTYETQPPSPVAGEGGG